MKLIQWLKSFFAWRRIGDQGVFRYELNTITKQRRARRIIRGGYSAKDGNWLAGGAWDGDRPRPPQRLETWQYEAMLSSGDAAEFR